MTELRKRMLEDLRIRNLSDGTQKSYVRHVAAFARHFGRSPDELGLEHIRAWQVHLIEERGVCWSSLNVAVSALRFFYVTTLGKDWAVNRIPCAKKERKLPVVISPKEVQRFLSVVTNIKYHAILSVAYSGGLRVSEIANLKIRDIDSERMVIRLRLRQGERWQGIEPNMAALDDEIGRWLKKR